nr:putative lysozyme-like protein [Setaria viridis]
MTQGDSSIAEYCSRMKTLADTLHNVGHPVQDSQLVLNLLLGLNPRFSNTSNDIANSTASFPSFTQARDMLAPKELRLANEEKISNSSSSSSSDCTGGCDPLSGSLQTGGSGGNSRCGRSGGSGGRTGDSCGSKKKW